MMSTASSN